MRLKQYLLLPGFLLAFSCGETDEKLISTRTKPSGSVIDITPPEQSSPETQNNLNLSNKEEEKTSAVIPEDKVLVKANWGDKLENGNIEFSSPSVGTKSQSSYFVYICKFENNNIYGFIANDGGNACIGVDSDNKVKTSNSYHLLKISNNVSWKSHSSDNLSNALGINDGQFFCRIKVNNDTSPGIYHKSKGCIAASHNGKVLKKQDTTQFEILVVHQ